MTTRAWFRVCAVLVVASLPLAVVMAQSFPEPEHPEPEHQGHEHQGHEHGAPQHGASEHEVSGQGGHAEPSEGMRHDGAIDHSFADAEAWAERFEGAERDAWQQPDRVLSALGLRSGMSVADIGSGTGYFSRRFAEAVGPAGTVFAADVEPGMAVYVRRRADEEEQANLVPVLASYNDPRLPNGGVDLIFVCNTWHHIQERVDYARRLAEDLKPGGRIAILDFVKESLPVGPPPEHKLSAAEVTEELTEAGYRLTETFDDLPYQYLLVFEPAAGAD